MQMKKGHYICQDADACEDNCLTVTGKGSVQETGSHIYGKNVDMLTSFMGGAYSDNLYSPIDIHMPDKRVEKVLEILSPADHNSERVRKQPGKL